jgi:type II secretory pathway component GspD/PulD (secretin)
MLHGMILVAAILMAAPAARAQGVGRPGSTPVTVFSYRPIVTSINVQTTVTVPDRGTALLGGYSQSSMGRTEYGAPGLGGVPYTGRGFRNVGYGHRTVSGRVTASVRIIDLREEEYRQTGVRSR